MWLSLHTTCTNVGRRTHLVGMPPQYLQGILTLNKNLGLASTLMITSLSPEIQPVIPVSVTDTAPLSGTGCPVARQDVCRQESSPGGAARLDKKAYLHGPTGPLTCKKYDTWLYKAL